MSEQVTAFEIDLSDVRNEAQDTQKTLKELRQEVKDLRSQLENTAIGTEEFTDTLDELTRKQQELTNVTKSGVAAQKDSYNDLVNQMAILKKEWRATADEAQRAALGEQIGDINTKLKEMDATLGNHQRNVGNYESTLENVNLQLQDQNNNFQTGLQTVQGLLGAYQLVEGALQAMGVESEAAEEAIRKMQGVMAMTDGLRAISEGVKGFQQLKVAISASSVATNGFKKALIATGIGALVVAVGTLAANWKEVTKWLDDAGVNMENFGKISSGVVSAVSQMFKNLGKGLVQVFKGEFKEAGDYFKEAFNFAENYQEGVAEKEEEIIKQANRTKLELYEQDQEHYIKMCEAKYGADWKYSQEGQRAYKALFEARAALYTQDLKMARENAIAKANYERELAEALAGKPTTTTSETINVNKQDNVITESIRKAFETQWKGGSGGIQLPVVEGEKSFWQKFNEGSEKTQQSLDLLSSTISDIAYQGEGISSEWSGFFASASWSLGNLIDEIKEAGEATGKGIKQWNSYGKAVSAGLGVAANLMNALASEQDKQTKEGFERQKKMNIAGAVMSTLSGIVDAWSSCMSYGPILGPIFGGTLTALMLTMGGLQISKLKGTPFSESADSALGGGVSATATPSFSALQQLQSGPQATTVIQGASTETDIKDTRVWVSEVDISNTQNKVRVLEAESTY